MRETVTEKDTERERQRKSLLKKRERELGVEGVDMKRRGVGWGVKGVLGWVEMCQVKVMDLIQDQKILSKNEGLVMAMISPGVKGPIHIHY